MILAGLAVGLTREHIAVPSLAIAAAVVVGAGLAVVPGAAADTPRDVDNMFVFLFAPGLLIVTYPASLASAAAALALRKAVKSPIAAG
jgi:hypothetical protein